jgi:hypothetical protein
VHPREASNLALRLTKPAAQALPASVFSAVVDALVQALLAEYKRESEGVVGAPTGPNHELDKAA